MAKKTKTFVFDLTLTEEEYTALANLLSFDSTVIPTKMAPFIGSFIAKFNTVEPREIVSQDLRELMDAANDRKKKGDVQPDDKKDENGEKDQPQIEASPE